MISKKEAREYRDILVQEEAYLRQVCQIVQSASLSDVSTSGQKLLKQLDQDRREHQSAICEANKITGRVCAECKDICCLVKEEEVIYRELNKYNIDNSLDNMISLLLHENYYRTDKKRDMHFAIGSIDLAKGDFISKIIEMIVIY